MSKHQKLLRQIPKVDLLLDRIQSMPQMENCPRSYIVSAIRETLDYKRRSILQDECDSVENITEIIDIILKHIHRQRSYGLRSVVNATGVILHTNLGRSILSAEVAEHVAKIASSYSSLEYDLELGGRGFRHSHVENILKKLTGCEAALVVNNNAAALLLIFTGLFTRREVIVSRGELVEIGGSFRIPDIMSLGGAILKEVGTTNRTNIMDYDENIDPASTGALLKVHTSNFRMIGFTESVSIAELSSLGRRHNLPLVCDVGSGALLNLASIALSVEPTVQGALNEGADIVCFSGDKLLGGSQAGFILGRKELIEPLKKHQLLRALRVDKMTLAALEATLHIYMDPQKAKENIPTLAMLYSEPEKLKLKAITLKRLLKKLPHFDIHLVKTESQTGGGAAPEEPLLSWALAVKHPLFSAYTLDEKLRCRDVPIIGRIFQEQLIFDVRTILESQFIEIFNAFEQIGAINAANSKI